MYNVNEPVHSTLYSLYLPLLCTDGRENAENLPTQLKGFKCRTFPNGLEISFGFSPRTSRV